MLIAVKMGSLFYSGLILQNSLKCQALRKMITQLIGTQLDLLDDVLQGMCNEVCYFSKKCF